MGVVGQYVQTKPDRDTGVYHVWSYDVSKFEPRPEIPPAFASAVR
jgi:hypothetical protein